MAKKTDPRKELNESLNQILSVDEQAYKDARMKLFNALDLLLANKIKSLGDYKAIRYQPFYDDEQTRDLIDPLIRLGDDETHPLFIYYTEDMALLDGKSYDIFGYKQYRNIVFNILYTLDNSDSLEIVDLRSEDVRWEFPHLLSQEIYDEYDAQMDETD